MKSSTFRPYFSSPQWSPPLNGGSTALVRSRAVVHAVAAMGPAAKRREHGPATPAEAFTKVLPQWSPSLNGGSTRPGPGVRECRFGAAMEPAAQRREHRPLPGLAVQHLPAAMEPAVLRREHPRNWCPARGSWRSRDGARRRRAGVCPGGSAGTLGSQ